MTEVAVAILNWNGQKHLKQFLPSVIANSGDHLIYVIDNGSTDNSISFLEKNYPRVRIIKLNKNYGFSEGYNRGLAQIKATYFLLLNSDIEVEPNWIDSMLQQLKVDKNVVACQPKILSYSKKQEFEHAGAAGGFLDKYGYPFCRGRIFMHCEPDHGQYDSPCSVMWASGACLLIESKVYYSLGGLDNHFFAHMEEIDLCWRIKNRGFDIKCYPSVKVYHLGGGTLSQSHPRKTFLNFRNGLALLVKNLPKGKVAKIIFIRLLLDGIAAIKFLFDGNFNHFWAVFRAHLHFYRMLPSLLKTRKKNLSHGTKWRHSEIYDDSIVKQFFFKKKHLFSDLKKM